MHIRSLSALIAIGLAGTAVAQTAAGIAPPSPPAPPAPPAGALPPLPPGCADGMTPPPPPPPLSSTDSDALRTTLGLSADKAARVGEVFKQQRQQDERAHQQRRDADAATCRSLREIVGDAGMARWQANAPRPPAPPAGPGPQGPKGPPAGADRPPPRPSAAAPMDGAKASSGKSSATGAR